MSQATREKFNLPPLRTSAPAAAAPPRRPSWDAVRGLWMLDGEPVDPQPAAPVAGLPVVFFAHQAEVIGAAPPAVKVMA
jgi:hypothetical protein